MKPTKTCVTALNLLSLSLEMLSMILKIADRGESMFNHMRTQVRYHVYNAQFRVNCFLAIQRSRENLSIKGASESVFAGLPEAVKGKPFSSMVQTCNPWPS